MSYINWHLIILIFVSMIVLPLLTAEILRLLGNHTKQRLVDSFGDNAQVIFGGLGVAIHELAHLLTAIIFGHHITGFRLLEPKQYQITGSLGYVSHIWNRRNCYQDLGNFFIGIAPVFFCSTVLWLLHGWLFGNSAMNYGSANNIGNALTTAGANIAHPFGTINLGLALYLVIIVMVSSTGYGLSDADMKGAMSGLIYWIGLLVILYLLVMATGYGAVIVPLLWKAIVLLLTFLGRGIIYIITALVLIDLVNIF